jgi:DNA-binding XRE family transcriptional regulator
MSVQPHTYGMPRPGYGERIRLVRKELGLTVVEFADSIQATASTVGRHEAMDDKPARNTWGIANSIELRCGRRWPGGLAHWIVEGHALGEMPTTCPACAARDSNPEPVGMGTLITLRGAA